MKVALIGYGYWGKILRKYIEESTIFELVQIYSSKIDGREFITDNIGQIVQNKEIEAVFICTPIETHFQLCSIFLKNNKHVFCEKPTVKDLKEFYLLKEIATHQQRILFTDYTYMFSPSILKIKELLSEVGNITHVEGRINQFGKFYQDADVFEVLGVHLISIVQFLFPNHLIESIDYTSDYRKSNCLDGSISIQYKNTFKARLYCSLLFPQKERSITIWGETGILYFNMYNTPSLQYLKIREKEGHTVIDSCMKWDYDESNNLKHAVKEFYDCIETKDTKNLMLSERVLELLAKRLN